MTRTKFYKRQLNNANITKTSLNDALGISSRTIAKIEKGEKL